MRVLWLKSELLHPLDKGGRIRSYHMLRALAAEHDVTYLALNDGSVTAETEARASEYADTVTLIPHPLARRRSLPFFGSVAANLGSRLPFAIARYMSADMTRAAATLAVEADVIVSDFLVPAVNMSPALRRRSVLFQHNVEAEIWRRHSEVATNAAARAYLRSQWSRMVRFEATACREFGHVIAVSEQDRDHFQREYAAPRVSAVGTGVDCDFFRPDATTARERDHLVFTGSMDWMPNEDGMLFFCDEVLPLLRQSRPGVRLTIVGRHPSPAMRALGQREGVEVTGTVKDVRPYLARAAAVVVPLRVGGGTRLKIYEALAMDCPLVSTTIGAEGLPLRDKEHLLIADEPAAIVARCLQLLEDQEQAANLGSRGGAFVRSHFSWPHVAQDFLRLCEAAQLTHSDHSLTGRH